MRDDSAHAGDSVRCGRIDAANPAMGDGAAQDRRMQHALALDVVNERAGTGDETQIFRPPDRLTDERPRQSATASR